MTDRIPTGFRVALAVMVGLALAALIVAAQATRRLSEVAQQTPWSLAQHRDQQHRFTVEAYDFVYRGESGNLIDEEILVFGAFEKERLFFMRDFLGRLDGRPNPPIVIDVGANTGHHSLFLSRLVGRVHAFEPFPPVIRRFKENLALNPAIDNIVLHEVGLGDADANLPFAEPTEDNNGVGTFRMGTEFSSRLATFDATLRIVPGDGWLAGTDLTGLALIKIDVEGFEEPVLVGLADTVKRYRPLVIVEVSPSSLGGTITSLEKLVTLLPERYGFLAFGPRSVEAAVAGTYSLSPLADGAIGVGNQIEVVAFPEELSAAVPRQ